MSKKKNDYDILEDEIVQEAEESEVLKPKLYIVSDCVRLNVRCQPSKEADVVDTLPCSYPVEIVDECPDSEFYKIKTPNIEGYCMKNYISEVE